jgi:hypothetical protein
MSAGPASGAAGVTVIRKLQRPDGSGLRTDTGLADDGPLEVHVRRQDARAGPALTGAERIFSILNVCSATEDLKAAAVIRRAATRLFAERGPAAVTHP